ncbi:MAG: hypothetical protein JNK76_09020 [Planctomycetales bacterium]|nr:hypothetical protein [Planctomycetales bacterium]MBN8624517.1 hypothetical protein [Planctomycetota bacterium]
MLRSILAATAVVAIGAGSALAADRGPMQLLGTQVAAQTSNAVTHGSAEVTPVRWGYNGYRGGYGGYRPYSNYYRGGYGGYYNNYYRPYGSYYRGGYGYGYRPYYGGYNNYYRGGVGFGIY